jgi:hypothetical protein
MSRPPVETAYCRRVPLMKEVIMYGDDEVRF